MTTENSWEERFDERFPDVTSIARDGESWSLNYDGAEIKAFLAKEIEAAKQRGRDMAVEFLQRKTHPAKSKYGFPLCFDEGSWTFLMKTARSLPDQHE